ncbi:hypothetical protein [Gordonia sp. NB41Y]|uniref:hypothetical protein n=1 Tax=Gordonia sp. NB41Y TaxID=875808 RepID=UPI00136495C8|nr:hypothetical protein [Gordonia sp. NB41Y]WLP90234.1 hypothetical protein Q9K23_22415 [Gordonia sp. NB41Y]
MTDQAALDGTFDRVAHAHEVRDTLPVGLPRAVISNLLAVIAERDIARDEAGAPWPCCQHCTTDDPDWHDENPPNTHGVSCTSCDRDNAGLRAQLAERDATIARVREANNLIHAHRFDRDPANREKWKSGERPVMAPDIFYSGVEFAHKRIRRALDGEA